VPYTRGGLIACDGDAYKLGHLDYGSSHFAGIIQARCRTVIKGLKAIQPRGFINIAALSRRLT